MECRAGHRDDGAGAIRGVPHICVRVLYIILSYDMQIYTLCVNVYIHVHVGMLCNAFVSITTNSSHRDPEIPETNTFRP